jgi:hypothetical protein
MSAAFSSSSSNVTGMFSILDLLIQIYIFSSEVQRAKSIGFGSSEHLQVP